VEDGVSIMAHLLKTPYKSDMERCADMTTFLVAGHDTTSYTIAWILVEVSKHPQICLKIQEEIALAVGNDVTHMSQQHLNKLVYLDYVIKEGMRLWPVAATGSARIASKDIKFQDMIIPKGCILNLPQYCLNRVGIKDPESFNPDRWYADSPDLEQLKVSFLPFALGKRNCIGQNLATFEMKLILATLFRYIFLHIYLNVHICIYIHIYTYIYDMYLYMFLHVNIGHFDLSCRQLLRKKLS
jgi:cytochrome P450